MASIALSTSLLKLHSSTAFTLAFLGLLVTAWLYAGIPLDCYHGSRGCGKDAVLIPWVYNFTEYESTNNEDDSLSSKTFVYVRHEWVGIVLFTQALLFAFPHWFWIRWNQANGIIVHASASTEKILKFTKVAVLLFCELFCWINAIVQSAVLNNYFESAFTQSGTNVFAWTWITASHRNDPFIRAFPRRLKCAYGFVRTNGYPEVVKQDYANDFCWLTVSPMMEKIFMVSWFWFVFLSVATSVVLLFHGSMWLMSCFGPCRITTERRRKSSEPSDESELTNIALA